MLAYNLLNQKTTAFYFPSGDNEDLSMCLSHYRRSYLDRKYTQNCRLNIGLNKNTPNCLKIKFSALERKIKGLTFFKDGFKEDYLYGIKLIYNSYYESKSKIQELSKKDKKIQKLADEYILMSRKY